MSVLRRRLLGAVCLLCVALAPAAALAARHSRGSSSHSNSILLRGPAYNSSYSSHPSIFSLPGNSAPPAFSNARWVRSFVWRPTGTVISGRGDGPKPGAAIPEPGAALLFGVGVGLVALHLHRRPRLATVR
jgi:hypothetical protein